MTGYHVGAVLTALLGILVIPSLGWRAMFVIGAAPALVLLPLMYRNLPAADLGEGLQRRAMAEGAQHRQQPRTDTRRHPGSMARLPLSGNRPVPLSGRISGWPRCTGATPSRGRS